MTRQASYGELVDLEERFDRQCNEMGITWTDDEIRNEAYLDFCSQYEDGNDNPEVNLCGYGYVDRKVA